MWRGKIFAVMMLAPESCEDEERAVLSTRNFLIVDKRNGYQHGAQRITRKSCKAKGFFIPPEFFTPVCSSKPVTSKARSAVVGHTGLTPQTAPASDRSGARQAMRSASIAEAGAFPVVLEHIPDTLAEKFLRRLSRQVQIVSSTHNQP
jgi:hypothetical protein